MTATPVRVATVVLIEIGTGDAARVTPFSVPLT